MKRFLLTLSLLFTASTAPAAVIYSGVQNILIPNTHEGVYLNIFTGATSASEPGDWNTAPWMNPFFGGTAIGTSALLRPIITGADQIENLAIPTLINSLKTYAAGESGSSTHIGMAANQFQIGTSGVMGFRFESGVGQPTLYGWLRFTPDYGSGAVIRDWAYEDSGAPLTIPEPSRALFALLGMASLVFRRRRA
jgi:MYXO-CTERM domain-containing protein